MPKKKKKGKTKFKTFFVNDHDLIDLSEEAERRFSDFQPLATATRMEATVGGIEEMEETLSKRLQEEQGAVEGAALEDAQRLRSVMSSPNYACSQTIPDESLKVQSFERLGARPKFPQTAKHFSSHTEREVIYYFPQSSELTQREKAMKSYHAQIEFFERELCQAKEALSNFESDKMDSRVSKFSETAILPSSSRPKPRPQEDVVSGQSEQRAVYMSQLSRDVLPSQITYATMAKGLYKLPETKGAAPSAGKSNLQKEAEMHCRLQEQLQALHQTLSNMSLTQADIQAMSQVSPQAQSTTPPGGDGVLLDGTQQYLMQQRQMAATPQAQGLAPPGGAGSIFAQIPIPDGAQQPRVQMQQPRVRAQMPPAAQQVFLPAQPAPFMYVPQQISPVVPLAGESKLKRSGLPVAPRLPKEAPLGAPAP